MNIFREKKISRFLLEQGLQLEKASEYGESGEEIKAPLWLLLKICPAIKQGDKNLKQLKKILNKLLQESNGKLLPSEKKKMEKILTFRP